MNHAENATLVRELRNNRLISEKTLPENISSFHYRPEVMFKHKWSKQTITTRGLFINTLTNEIVIRAYDKFFNVNETRQTEYRALAENLTFPVTAWVKENGYLGLVGYDSSAGDLVFASKSTTEGEFAGWFRDLFESTYDARRDYLARYLETHNATMVCEVVLPARDPHIIEYRRDEIVLLELIKRQREYESLPETERDTVAKQLGIPQKKKAVVLDDWEAFEAWHKTIQGMGYLFDGKEIEGFVLEDAAGWHVKIKLDYYTFWKQLRSALDQLQKGKQPKVPAHSSYPEEAARVIAFMQQLPPDRLATLHITTLRTLYLANER